MPLWPCPFGCAPLAMPLWSDAPLAMPLWLCPFGPAPLAAATLTPAHVVERILHKDISYLVKPTLIKRLFLGSNIYRLVGIGEVRIL